MVFHAFVLRSREKQKRRSVSQRNPEFSNFTTVSLTRSSRISRPPALESRGDREEVFYEIIKKEKIPGFYISIALERDLTLSLWKREEARKKYFTK